MNTQEIIENNTRIAKFLYPNNTYSTYYIEEHSYIEFKYGEHDYHDTFSVDELQYHNSYNWLMPVLQKIQNSGCIIEINYSLIVTCRICYLGKNKYDKAINFYGDNNGGEKPIMAIYECVVEFLKYLENEKENNK